MVALFAWATAVQRNDPDAARWMALYGAAALLALFVVVGRPPLLALRALGAIALVWAAAILPELFGRWSVRDLGASMSTGRPEVEYGRELGGLLIVATYCFVTARLVIAWRRSASADASARKDAR